MKEGVEEYAKRLSKYIKVQVVEIPDIKRSAKITGEEVKKKEASLIMAQFKPADFVVLLDEKGKRYNSVSFSGFLEKKLASNPVVTLVVGGAYGFHDEVYNRSNAKLSLSDMTFSHQLIRVLLFEQLYRAYTILKGDPYHNA